MSRRARPNHAARKVWLVLVLVAVFLTVGVPRWLADDDAPVSSDADARFSMVCRDHGGTPATSASATSGAGRRCTVRYGRQVYLMDAITPDGFDEDTARFQRQGCEEADREQRASSGSGHRQSFVYHPATGVCERRP
jgi:hypothetical protein